MSAIKLKTRNPKNNYHLREDFAKILSCLIMGESSDHLPYRKDEDGYNWVLDGHNDWFLHFDIEYPHMFKVRHRYNCDGNPYERVFADWLKLRFPSITEVEETKMEKS